MSALKDLLKSFIEPVASSEKPVGLTGLDIALANYFNTHQVSDDLRHQCFGIESPCAIGME
jgi:hypothetical protein